MTNFSTCCLVPAGVAKQHERVETPINNSRCVIHCSLTEQLAGNNRERTGWCLWVNYRDVA